MVERQLLPTPYDWDGLLRFLRARAIPGVEVVDLEGATYRRSTRHGEVTIRFDGDSVELDTPHPDDRARSHRLLDLSADPVAVAAVVAADPALGPLVRATPGLRIPGAWDGFELVIRAVVGQQVSVAAARTLLGRLVALAGAAGPAGPVFPDPTQLAAADLESFGMPASRRRTLRTVAEAAAAGQLLLEPGDDPVEASRRLVALPGIGPWTAAYVCLRALGDRDAFLVGDLALRKAAVARGLPERWPDLVERAERWRPFRAYACMWLWTA